MNIFFKVLTCIFIAIYAYVGCELILHERKKLNKKVLAIIIISVIIYYVIIFLIDQKLSAVLLSLMFIPMLKRIFNKNLVTIAIISLTIYLIRLLGKIITLCFSKDIYDNIFSLENYNLDKLLINIISLIFSLIIIYLFKKYINKFIKWAINLKYCYVIILPLLFLNMFLILFFAHPFMKISINVFTDCTLIVILIMLFSYLIDKDSKLESISKYYNDIFEYSKLNDELNYEYRMKVHENKNQLLVIKGMLKKGKKKNIENYIDNLLEIQKKDVKNYWLSYLASIPVSGIKNFLNYKLIELKNLGAVIEVFVSKDLKKIDTKTFSCIKYNDLTIILGVVLDNIIDSIKQTDKKLVSINIYLDNNEIHGKFANTFSGNIDFEKLFRMGYSTKGRQHGIGLALVQDIISNNDSLDCKPRVLDNFFIQEVIVKLKDIDNIT